MIVEKLLTKKSSTPFSIDYLLNMDKTISSENQCVSAESRSRLYNQARLHQSKEHSKVLFNGRLKGNERDICSSINRPNTLPYFDTENEEQIYKMPSPVSSSSPSFSVNSPNDRLEIGE